MEKYFYKMNDKDYFNDKLLLTSASIKTTKTSSKFATFNFMNKAGETISAKRWGTNSVDDLSIGKVYDVYGEVQVYNKSLSVVVKQMILTDETTELYPKENPYTNTELKNLFSEFYNSIKDEKLKAIIEFTIKKVEFYFESKAAKNIHHAFEGGLAYHSLTMARTADMLSTIYPQLNRDLLVTAAILHDAGKVIELDEKGYTYEGILFGHIIIMNDILQEFLFQHPELKDSKIIAHLKHIILSHHGKLEWGSPVMGATPEAIIFHHIDKIDADMQISTKELSEVNPMTATNRVWSMDSRVLFNMSEDNENK